MESFIRDREATHVYNTAYALCMLDDGSYKHTLRMWNIYFSSTANVVTRTRFCFTFISTWPVLLNIIHVKVTAAVWVRTLASLCEVFGGQSGTCSDFFSSTCFFPCQCHSTNAACSSSSKLLLREGRPV